jgi:hypothetical protein
MPVGAGGLGCTALAGMIMVMVIVSMVMVVVSVEERELLVLAGMFSA